jgi:hypothetical protein
MTRKLAEAIVDNIQYRNWTFEIGQMDTGLYLRVKLTDDDGTPWTGRKWFISQHSTRSEVVQTAFKAVITAEEHEIRETFKYRGKAVFGPHFDVDALYEIAGKLDIRGDKP